jgi:hypothetical protein
MREAALEEEERGFMASRVAVWVAGVRPLLLRPRSGGTPRERRPASVQNAQNQGLLYNAALHTQRRGSGGTHEMHTQAEIYRGRRRAVRRGSVFEEFRSKWGGVDM